MHYFISPTVSTPQAASCAPAFNPNKNRLTMPTRFPSAQSVTDVLQKTPMLHYLLERCHQLNHLQSLVEAQLQPAARPHCKIGSWQKGCLLLVITDSNWATRLRYMERRLKNALRQSPELADLQRILFKVSPPLPSVETSAANKPKPRLSPQAAHELRAAAAELDNPALCQALRRLASRAEPSQDD